MNNLYRNLILAAALSLSFTAMACEPIGGSQDCDPEEENCICTYEGGEVCEDPDDLDCACTLIEDADNDGIPDDEDQTPDGENPDEDKVKARFVLIEDLTDPIGGDAPGADIDAISVIKNEAEYFATAVEDQHLGGQRNAYLDIQEVLGAPDSECEKKNFASLGGARAGGYVVVSFGTANQDVTISNGDSIRVHEIGRTLCPNTSYDDDPYRVSVSVSTDLGTFHEIGTGGEGKNTVPVTGLD